jgi:hypothetical protein
MQLLRPARARVHHLWVFVGIWGAFLLLGACDTPTWVVLRSRCGAADGGPGCDAGTTVRADAGTQAIACGKDLECPTGELCVKGQCAPCDGTTPTCPSCDPGSSPATTSLNGCPLCVCVATMCKRHADCPAGSVCEKNVCVGCESASASKCPGTCPWSFKQQALKQNGCALCECAPTSTCVSDADCGTGLHCYRGQQCQDGCSDLGCCFGNFCGLPGCEDPPALGCDVVGCASGTCSGDVACGPSVCKCDGKAFVCADNCPDPVCIP